MRSRHYNFTVEDIAGATGKKRSQVYRAIKEKQVNPEDLRSLSGYVSACLLRIDSSRRS